MVKKFGCIYCGAEAFTKACICPQCWTDEDEPREFHAPKEFDPAGAAARVKVKRAARLADKDVNPELVPEKVLPGFELGQQGKLGVG